MQSKSYQETSEKLHRDRQLFSTTDVHDQSINWYPCRLWEASVWDEAKASSWPAPPRLFLEEEPLASLSQVPIPRAELGAASKSPPLASLRPRLQRLGGARAWVAPVAPGRAM